MSSTIPPTGKYIAYDRATKDYAFYYDGQLIGFTATYADAERLLDIYVYELAAATQVETADQAAAVAADWTATPTDPRTLADEANATMTAIQLAWKDLRMSARSLADLPRLQRFERLYAKAANRWMRRLKAYEAAFTVGAPVANDDGSYDVTVTYQQMPLVHRLHNRPQPCWEVQTECVQVRAALPNGDAPRWVDVEMARLSLPAPAIAALQALWHALFDAAPCADAPNDDNSGLPRRITLPAGSTDLDDRTLEAAYALALAADDLQTERWQKALARAFDRLHELLTVDITRDGALVWYPDRDGSGLYQPTPERCQCEAASNGQPCRHRAAALIVAYYPQADAAFSEAAVERMSAALWAA